MMYTNFKTELLSSTKWLMFAGFIDTILGILLLISFYLPIQTLNIVLIIAYLIIAIICMLQAFFFWFRKIGGLVLHLGASALYFALALLFFASEHYNIYNALYVCLLLLVVAYVITGIFRIYVSIAEHLHFGWLFTFYCGLIDLFMAVLILIGINRFPYSALIVATGADILFTGIALIALSFGSQQLRKIKT